MVLKRRQLYCTLPSGYNSWHAFGDYDWSADGKLWAMSNEYGELNQMDRRLIENNVHVVESKQARIIAMLRTPSGATLEAMVDASGWQQHSVRGFLAGVVRKKLGLNLISGVGEGGRVYRINDRTASPNSKTNRAA